MARNPRVEVAISGDPRGLNRAFRSAGQSGTRFGRGLATVGRTAGVAFAAIAAGAVVAGKHLFDQAVELERMANKAEIVFGDSIDMVNEWAEANAHAMGLTTAEATGVAASIADILVPLGYARDEAADMAVEIAGLSGALAEWDSQGRSAAEVGYILQQSLTGEREALKSLGAVFGEADVQAKILEHGLDDLTGEAEKQAVAMATLELVTEATEDAQTSFAENSDSMARKQAVMGARMRELRDELATKLTPVFIALGDFLFEHVIPAIETTYRWLDENLSPVIADVASWVQGTLVPALRNMWQWFAQKILPIAVRVGNKVGGWLLDRWNDLYAFIKDDLIPWLRNLWQWFAQKILPIVVRVGQKVGNFLYRNFLKVKNFIMGDFGESLSNLEGLIDDQFFAWEGWDDIVSTIEDSLRDIYEFLEPHLKRAVDDLEESVDNVVAAFEALGLTSDEAKVALTGLLVLAVLPLIASVTSFVLLIIGWAGAFAVVARMVKILTDRFLLVAEVIGWLIPIWQGAWDLMWDGINRVLQVAIALYNKIQDIIGILPNVGFSIGPLQASSNAPPSAGSWDDVVNGGGGNRVPANTQGPNPDQGRAIVVNVHGTVLSDRDLEWKFQDMRRRGVLG